MAEIKCPLFTEVLAAFYLSIFHPLLEATLASLRSSMSVCENVLKSCGVKEFRLGFAGAWVPSSRCQMIHYPKLLSYQLPYHLLS